MPSFEEILLELSRGSGTDSDHLGMLGKQAAKSMIEDGADPSAAVQKIASAEGLGPNEIQRVCEATNLEGYRHFMKQAGSGDKTFEFPLADYTKVKASANKTKTAGPTVFGTEYDRAPDADLCMTAGDDEALYEAFGVSMETEKVASYSRADKLIGRLTLLAQNEQDKLAANMEAMSENADKFYEHIKQLVLSGTFFDDVDRSVQSKVKGMPYEDRVLSLLAYSKRRMYDEGLIQLPKRTGDSGESPDTINKTAEPVEHDLITDTFESPGIPVSVINGRHKLYATIDTLVRQFEERDAVQGRFDTLNDKLKYTKHRVYGKKHT